MAKPSSIFPVNKIVVSAVFQTSTAMDAAKQKLNAIIRGRRARAYADAAEDARALGMCAEDTRMYLFDADSSAIWDAQQGLPYSRPVPPKKEVAQTKYTEMGFLSDEQFKALMGRAREKQ